ncbi:alpha/beta hydrolase [Niallia sp. XMNu-256]|uniref:alpha/beta fold hydrolase n=1 Tax=Niallia sp. XMNu-256 TaxID=3082444 RepID=UPI0030CEA6C5
MNYRGMYYEVKGEGFPIIFIPGTGSTHKMFAPQVNYLSKSFQTITLDLRGTGQSEPFKCLNPWKYLKLHAKSIVELMDYLHIERAIFVGVSYGGMVAQEMAKIHETRVEKLVIIDSYARIIPYSFDDIRIGLLGAGFLISMLVPYKWLLPIYQYYSKWELTYEEILRFLKNRKSMILLMQLIGTIGLNNLDRIKESTIPILALAGDESPQIVRLNKEIAMTAPEGNFIAVENAFDPSNLCNPQQVNEAIYSFIEDYKC